MLQWATFGVVALVVGVAGIRAGAWLRARNAPPVVEAPDFPFMPGDALPDVLLADSLGTEIGSIALVAGQHGAIVLFLDPNCDGCSAMAEKWENALSEGVVQPERIFGVTSETPAANTRYRAEHALTYPIYQDVESAYLLQHGVVSYPMEVVVDASGMIQAVSSDSRAPVDGESVRALIKK